ncbi:MAG: hypothetical protein BGO28_01465 [Alphaproteobacteria bacterium 43-37]|nr:MAG: hypothetical protein BGO28_01465 [Alphaproteobacteria bacterium 43-37]
MKRFASLLLAMGCSLVLTQHGHTADSATTTPSPQTNSSNLDLHANMINGDSKQKGTKTTSSDTATLSSDSVSTLKAATKKVDGSLDNYVKTLDDATKNNADVKKALETLKALQSLRTQALDKLSQTPTLKSSDIQSLHSAEDTNAAISALKDDNDERKKAKAALSTALVDFKDTLDKATRSITKQASSATTDPKAAAKQSNHDAMVDHHNELADHIEALRKLLEEKEDVTSDHHHALEFLEEEHERRAAILQKAQSENRPITQAEAAEIQKANNSLHVALGLLPQDTPEEQALSDKIIAAHSDLVDQADHHEDLHATDSLPSAGNSSSK